MPVKKPLDSTVSRSKRTTARPKKPSMPQTASLYSQPMPNSQSPQPHAQHDLPHHRRLHHVLYVSEFTRKIVWTLFGLFLVFLCVFVHVQSKKSLQEYFYVGQADRQERMLTLSAVGVAEVNPDTAHVTMGLSTEADTVEEAQQQNSETMNQLLTQLAQMGIDKADVQTSNYSVYPLYDYSSDEGREVLGQQVSQQVTITIRNVDMAQEVLGLAGRLGLNTVSGLRFSTDNTEAAIDLARQDALRQIDMKLKHIQKSVDVRVRSVASYNEYEQGGQGPYPFARSANFAIAEDAAFSPQVEQGTEEVRLEVVVGFEMK